MSTESAIAVLAASKDWDSGAVIIVAMALIVGVPLILYSVLKIQGERAESRHRASAFEQNQRFQRTGFDRDQAMGELVAEKYRAEARLLELQVKLAQSELEHRERHQEFEVIAKQKTMLEIESMKLHIREQRKSLDEFGQQDYD